MHISKRFFDTEFFAGYSWHSAGKRFSACVGAGTREIQICVSSQGLVVECGNVKNDEPTMRVNIQKVW